MYRSAELIAEVKKKPSLWDAAYKHCADKDLRDMHWLEVAKVLFPNWDTLGLTERNDKLFEIKRRWKNIRDYYRKESKRWKGKRYMYKDLLKFLDEPPSEANDVRSESVVKHEVSLSPQHNQESFGGIEDIPFVELPSALQILTTSKTQETANFGEADSVSVKRKLEDDVDEDKSFLLSMLPEMRKLSGRQKMDFKISVLNELRIARYKVQLSNIKEEESSE